MEPVASQHPKATQQSQSIASADFHLDTVNTEQGATVGMPVYLQRSNVSQPTTFLQPKLTVSEPGDMYEQEADQIAKRVIQPFIPTPKVTSVKAIDPTQVKRKPNTCKTEEQPGLQSTDNLIQRASDSSLQITDNLESRLNGSKGGGSSLSNEVLAFMEPRFGTDFSQVKVHTDNESSRMNQELQAQAFTHKQDVYFGAAKYNPDSQEGKELLAHELTHVVQQTGNESQLHRQPEKMIMRDSDPTFKSEYAGYSLGNTTLQTRNQDNLGIQTGQAPSGVGAEVTRQEQYFLDVGMMHPSSRSIARNPRSIVQRDAGGGRPSKYGDIDVDVLESFILAGQWQNTADFLDQISDNQKVLKILGELKQIPSPSGESLLKIFLRNKPTTTPRLDSLLSRSNDFTVLDSIHSDEHIYNRDKFVAQTFSAIGDPIPDVIVADEQKPKESPIVHTLSKELSVFVPKGVPSTRNQVHIFFTPFVASYVGAAGSFVAQQGLRAETDASPWILIAVPALFERDQPNFVTISTPEIEDCLTAAGRKANIDAIRLSAHSRGHRGLENTIGLRPGTKPLIDLSLVEKVTVFDASYKDLGTALTSHKKELTAMTDPKKGGEFIPGAVRLYDVTVANISGLRGIGLNVSGIRALSYARLIKEGTARGTITPSDIDSIDPVISSAINRVLAKLPDRGKFSTQEPVPGDKVSLQEFLKNNRTDMTSIDSQKVKTFITTKKLDWGAKFSMEIDAHHWFVAELAHEAVE